MGSPPEKGGKKKTKPWYYPGQVRRLHSEPAEKGEKKKKKKNLVLTLGSPPDLGFRTSVSEPGFQDSDARNASYGRLIFFHHFSLRPPSLFFFPSLLSASSGDLVCASNDHRQTHRLSDLIYKIIKNDFLTGTLKLNPLFQMERNWDE